MKELLNAMIQTKLCNKNKNIKYGASGKDNLKSTLQTCKNKSRKELNKVAFLSGMSRFDAKKNDTLGPGRNNNCYSIILNKHIFLKLYYMNKFNF